jgi:hypothetical protein
MPMPEPTRSEKGLKFLDALTRYIGWRRDGEGANPAKEMEEAFRVFIESEGIKAGSAEHDQLTSAAARMKESRGVR